MKTNIIIIIPAYKPSNELMILLNELKKQYKNIVVVNDGSGSEYNIIFDRIESDKDIDLVTHIINKGKGKSIKDAIEYAFKKYKEKIVANEIIGFLTCDADGQHTINDINKCASCLKTANDNILVLGTRTFDKTTPLRSKFGNEVTCKVLNALHRINLKDTQTGLRCFTTSFAKDIINLHGDRYEYEINMLIFAKQNNYNFKQIDIATIYIDNNSESHFNPIVDSIKIYAIVLREFITYSVVAILSFLCDNIFFFILFNIFIENRMRIIYSTIIARIFSSMVNFYLNDRIVFKNKCQLERKLLKYYLLVFINMLLSATLVNWIYTIMNKHVFLIKIIIDTLIFVINYCINKYIVFKNIK